METYECLGDSVLAQRPGNKHCLAPAGRLVLSILLFGLIQCGGCASRSVLPADWTPVPAGKGIVCAVPTGDFSNYGTSNDVSVPAPTLSALLFNEELEGFAIDRVRITEPKEKALQVNVMVGDVQLKEEQMLEPEGNDCGGKGWLMKTPKKYVNGYDAAASIMWTAGALMPIAFWKNYRFQLAEDGSLLLHLQQREVVDFFYFFPAVLTTDDVWFRYAPADSQEPAVTTVARDNQP